jgi:hypothetical protein
MRLASKKLCAVREGYVCDPSIQTTEAGGSRFSCQPGLHSETLTQKKKKHRIKTQEVLLFLLQRHLRWGGRVAPLGNPKPMASQEGTTELMLLCMSPLWSSSACSRCWGEETLQQGCLGLRVLHWPQGLRPPTGARVMAPILAASAECSKSYSQRSSEPQPGLAVDARRTRPSWQPSSHAGAGSSARWGGWHYCLGCCC